MASLAGVAQVPLRQQPTPANDDEEHFHHDTSFYHDRDHDHDHSRSRLRSQHEQNIIISSGSKQAEQTIAPFLAEHIPAQYNPVGSVPRTRRSSLESSNAAETHHLTSSKFCYRHRPDLKCRRQANEPSMEQLQNGLASLSQSDQQAISHVWSLFSAAPGKHRNLMLQGILTQCCFPQLSFISANVRDLIKIDFLSALPAELGFKILCYLDTTSLCKATQVSQRWRELADDDVVWHKMCEQHIDRKCTKCGWGLPLLERKRLRIEKRQIQLRATGRGLNEWSPNITPLADAEQSIVDPIAPALDNTEVGSSGRKRSHDFDEPLSPESLKRQRTQSECGGDDAASGSYFVPRKRPWKDVYRDRFKVGTAWKYGRCSTKVFKGHSNGVMCLQFDENVLISGSYDTTVKVWDISTGQELRTLTGHTSGVRCLQFDDNKLMTGSLDGTLRLWNWRTGQCLRSFPAHTQGIITLHFSGRYVASGSMDGTARVWDSETKQTFLLRGHTDWVNCVRVDQASRTLFTASDDLSVRLWDLDTKECIREYWGHVGQVQSVLPMPAEFELEEIAPMREQDDDASSVNSVNHYAQSHEIQSRPITTPFWPDQPDRAAPPRYMFTGALDSTIRLWDVHAPRQATAPSTTESMVLRTDPLTNSHLPRAQSCIRTFFGHVEGIWALAADHLRLISGSEDRILKIWDPRTGRCERSVSGHAGPVTCAALSDSRIATGSEDCEVRLLTFG